MYYVCVCTVYPPNFPFFNVYLPYLSIFLRASLSPPPLTIPQLESEQSNIVAKYSSNNVAVIKFKEGDHSNPPPPPLLDGYWVHHSWRGNDYVGQKVPSNDFHDWNYNQDGAAVLCMHIWVRFPICIYHTAITNIFNLLRVNTYIYKTYTHDRIKGIYLLPL